MALTIIRKRYIPNEEVDISKDTILFYDEKLLVTKWLPINPRKDFAWGISYVNLHDNYKISRFYDRNDKFLFWYCDVLEVSKTKSGSAHDSDIKYTLTDLLIDVIVYPNGHYEVKDIDELNEAFENNLITKEQYNTSVEAMKRLLNDIKDKKFPPADFNYKDFEKNNAVKADLHIHSSHSDGTFTPKEIVRLAKELNLDVISLTDHDMADGIAEAEEEAKRLGIGIIPGAEFSSGDEIHILGYFPDGGIEGLESIFQASSERRKQRAHKMVEKFTDLGLPIAYEEIIEEAGGEKFIARVHFAKLLVKKGYTTSVSEAFKRWLNKGRPGYVGKENLSSEAVINVINQNNGIPVLAHPGKIKMGKRRKFELIKDLKGFGLRGLEVYYSGHTPAETKEYEEIAQELGLIKMGGSDFHGGNKPDIMLGGFEGNVRNEENSLLFKTIYK